MPSGKSIRPEMVPGGPGDGGGRLPPQQHAGIVQARLIRAAVGRHAVTKAPGNRSWNSRRMAVRAYTPTALVAVVSYGRFAFEVRRFRNDESDPVNVAAGITLSFSPDAAPALRTVDG